MAKKTAKAPWASKPKKETVTVTPSPEPLVPVDETPLSFESPTSSNILGASFNPMTGELIVQFHGGRSYRYTSVPRDLWDDFDAAESRGAFFAARIKDKGFGGERL